MSSKKIKAKTKILKFHTSKNYIVALTIAFVVFLIVYLLLKYYDNSFSIDILINKRITGEEIQALKEKIKWINMGETVLLFFLSAALSSILGVLWGIKAKNNLYSDLLTNDVFASEDFYNALSSENREKIHNNLNEHLLFDGSKIKTKMYSYVTDKLNDSFDDNYYYEECNYDIKCTIFEDRLEKKILKTIKLKPIKEKHTLKEIRIASSKYMANEKSKFGLPFDKVKVKINNSTVDKQKYIKEIKGEITDTDKKSGYNEHKIIKCTKTIDLSNKKAQKIEIEYTTIVPPNDLSYVCRLDHACKKYSFNFSVISKNKKEYSIDVAAFGFLDDASGSPVHSDDDMSAIVKFDNWMFPQDGVSLSLIEKE